MEKTIEINGVEVRMRANALIPRLYRFEFGRDVIQDIKALETRMKKAATLKEDATEEEKKEAQFSALDLTIFENIAWLFARQADPEGVPDSPDEWLEQFEMFGIYQVLPQILELWAMSQKTTAQPKKK